MKPRVGSRITIRGGYEAEPSWLKGRDSVSGAIVKWIPGQNTEPACVVRLDEPLAVECEVQDHDEVRAGSFLVLELRYVAAEWGAGGTVHVELCDVAPPDDCSWSERPHGAWVASHATYEVEASLTS